MLRRMTVLKKYSNRRLYDTERSRYVNLDDVATMIRAGEEVRVEDAKTGEDLTREVLLQVVVELHGGMDFLPVGLLRRIIRATGDDPFQRVLRQQLASALELLGGQMDRVERQFEQMFPGFGKPPPPPPKAAAPEPPPAEEAPPPSPAASGAGEDEIGALRARLSALEERLKGRR